jgi:hypothetical protein
VISIHRKPADSRVSHAFLSVPEFLGVRGWRTLIIREISVHRAALGWRDLL